VQDAEGTESLIQEKAQVMAKKCRAPRRECVEKAILGGEYDSVVERRCYVIKQKRYGQARMY
jgi:hypothetical protein